MTIYQLLITLHILGTAIGVGGATVSDVLFFRSLRDGVISKDEYSILQILTKIVMAGYILLILSGLGFLGLIFFSGGTTADLPDKVFAKLTIVAVILINSQLLHHKVMPLIAQNVGKDIISVIEKHSLLVLSAGAVSATSWYTTLLLGSWRGLQTDYITIMIVYGIAVISAVAGANIVGFPRLSKLLRLKKLGVSQATDAASVQASPSHVEQTSPDVKNLP